MKNTKIQKPDGKINQWNSGLRPLLNFLGLGIIVIGIALILNQYFHTGWLILIILPVISLVVLIFGFRQKTFTLLLPGGILFFLGLGGFLTFYVLQGLGMNFRIGILSVSLGICWLTVTSITALFNQKIAWWALIPGLSFIGTGISLIFTHFLWFDAVFWTLLGLGIAFLVWSYGTKNVGLAIPGSLLVAIAPGVFFGWRNFSADRLLIHIGIMLSWFAIGWGLIILFWRVIRIRFIWWPLIPGGVLAVVGWGLYISQNPGNAISFISNTSAIMLIILGIYLLLLRSSLHK
jgi:hypothetical protein